MTEFDNIIIGSGPGGYKLAAALAAKGESTAVVERSFPGGTCLNRGCIPTKCLCATASAMSAAKYADHMGVKVDILGFDYRVAASRKDAVVEQLRGGVLAVIKNCTLINGSARLMPGRVIEVSGELYKAARRLVIATGSAPATLPVDGAELALSSDDALAFTSLPQSIIIIGGGVIGMEFASMYNVMGADVTVVEYCSEILPPFDAEIAKRLRTALTRRGVNIITNACVESITRQIDQDMFTVHYTGKRGEAEISASTVLMAVGRQPVIPDGCREAGITLTSRGFIAVDDMMRTTADGVYAIGDVNGLSMLAHSAIAQGHVIEHDNSTLFNTDATPSVVFTIPEVAQVGPTSAQLTARNIPHRTIKRTYGSVGKALAEGFDGLVKIIVTDDSESRIIGISILGPHAADLIAEATILTTDKVPFAEVATRYIHAHPTLSEIFC
ncbi:MAG: FAD-dependent oxidoreductase [Muribaculaceae bacterium]|nr:FAD-dependent oxidoreductase [Muribaculaceae bacterium]